MHTFVPLHLNRSTLLPSWTCLHPISRNGRRLIVNCFCPFFSYGSAHRSLLATKYFIFLFSSADSCYEQSQLTTPPYRPFQEQEKPPIVSKLPFVSFFPECDDSFFKIFFQLMCQCQPSEIFMTTTTTNCASFWKAWTRSLLSFRRLPPARTLCMPG